MNSSTIQIIAQVFLWIAVLSGTAILLPQVIRLHKNKYADNSSIGLYAFYLGCNIIWTIYQSLYITTSSETETLQKAMLWIQLGGDIIQVTFGAYSFFLKLYYMISARFQKDNYVWIMLKRRAEVSLFLTKERVPMRKVLEELLKLYPQLKTILQKQAKRNTSIKDYINSRTAVELAVINAYLLKKVINRKYNPIDPNIAINYKKFTAYAVNKIDSLSADYIDIINGLYHHRVKKVPLYKARKIPKTKADLNSYLTRLNVVDKWAFLSQIYQSLLSI